MAVGPTPGRKRLEVPTPEQAGQCCASGAGVQAGHAGAPIGYRIGFVEAQADSRRRPVRDHSAGDNPPYRYITAEGDVTSIGPAEDAGVRELAVGYLGAEAGDTFTDENLTPTSIAIRMRPARWLSVDYAQ